MAEIPLGEYAGYIFTEMVRAREIADRYSRALAARYAADDVMRHFSVPRFKIPKMELTMPVLVVDADVRRLVRFTMPEDDFVDLIVDRVGAVRTQLDSDRLHGGGLRVADVQAMARELHAELVETRDGADATVLVESRWRALLERALRPSGTAGVATDLRPDPATVDAIGTEIVAVVAKWSMIEPSALGGLMVDPVTHAVRDGSTDSTVFVVSAELVEDGFFIRAIKDTTTGHQQPIVEFD